MGVYRLIRFESEAANLEESKMVEKNDWRLMNQEKYLKNKNLLHINYNQEKNHDHDHCAFCMEKFTTEQHKGYCTEDYYYWICEKCFDDFKGLFNWTVVETK